MSIFGIAWRYLWSRPLITALTLFSIALGAGLISSVITLRSELEKSFMVGAGTFDFVVGAKGSPLQLVLSSLYHMDQPTGNIPYARYEAIKKDFRVQTAIPIGLGDNYNGYRIIGTSKDIFKLMDRKDDPSLLFEIADGRTFEKQFEVVLGASVAKQAKLKLGDQFSGVHGLLAVAGSQSHDEFPFTVVGIMKPTGTAHDRVIFTPLESVWTVHEYEDAKHAAPNAAKKERETTAIWVQLRAPGMRLWMVEEIKKKTESMAAIPVNEMLRLYQNILQPMQRILMVLAYLVVLVAACSIITSLYQAVERRQQEITVMRTLGAHPYEIHGIIIFESVLLSVMGAILGYCLGHGGLALASVFLLEHTGMSISAWASSTQEFIYLGVVILSGLIAGIVPIILHYKKSK